MQFLLDRRNVVRNFLHERLALVVDKGWRKVHLVVAHRDPILVQLAKVLPVEAIGRVIVPLQFLVVSNVATDCEVLSSIEGVGLHQLHFLHVFASYKRVKELAL